MRMFRAVLAALVTAVLVAGALSAGASAGSAPKRIIEEDKPTQVGYSAFKLKGTVSNPQVDGTLLPYADGKVEILKKACGSCKWKKIKTVKTDESGVFKTKIYAPTKGTWRWRSKVPYSDGYGNTKGKVWYLSF